MSFKFNFSTPKEVKSDLGNEPAKLKNKIPELPCIEIHPSTKHLDTTKLYKNKLSQSIRDKTIYFLDTTEVEEAIKSGSNKALKEILKVLNNHSDLQTGIYEGGLKIWECSLDLINHLAEENVQLDEKSVLELGCGAGLPGIYALLKNASVVYFQDYNFQVLDMLTIPNVGLNSKFENIQELKARFLAGDWKNVEEFLLSDLAKPKFDYIFASETIYNPNNYNKLCSLMRLVLKKTGCIFIAAKTCYFGIGGSTRQFEQLLLSFGDMDVVSYVTDYSGVQREILKVTYHA